MTRSKLADAWLDRCAWLVAMVAYLALLAAIGAAAAGALVGAAWLVAWFIDVLLMLAQWGRG